MKKILFFLLFLGCISSIYAQNITVRRLKADSIYILKSSNLLSDTAVVISKGKMYWRVLSDTAFIPTWVDSCGYADSAAVAGLCDSAAVSGNSWQLMGKDTTEIYIGAAGQTGQCITARKDTVQGCSQDWVNIDDSLHVMGKLDCDTAYYINSHRLIYSNYNSKSIFICDSAGINNANYIETDNIGIGFNALKNNSIGSLNIAIGKDALKYNKWGLTNTSIGWSSLANTKYSSRNVAIGESTGTNARGNNCIYIGHSAGFNINDSLDYRIYINSIVRATKKQDTTHSIIYGKQATDSIDQFLYFNAHVNIAGHYTLPFTDSIAGKVLTTNGTGKVYWGAGGSGSFDMTHCYDSGRFHAIIPCSDLLIKGGLKDSLNAGGSTNLFLLNTLNFRNYIINGSFIELTPYLHTYTGAIDSNNVLVTLNGTVRTVGKGLNSTPTTGSLFKTGDTTIMYGIVIKDGKSTGFRVDSSGLFEVANRDKVTMELTPVDDTVKLIHSPTFLSQNLKPYGFYKTDGTNTYLNGYYNTKALSPLGGNMFGQLWANSTFTKYSTFNVYEGDGNGAMVFYSANSADTSAIDFNVFKTDGIDFIVKNHSTGHVNQRRFFVDTQGSIWGIACYMNGYANFGQGSDTAVGSYNIVGGLYGKAIGSYNLMGGYNNIDTGNYNLMSGSGGIIKSDYCGMTGQSNIINTSCTGSFAINSNNKVYASANGLNTGSNNFLNNTNYCANIGGTSDSVTGAGGGPMGNTNGSVNIGGLSNRTTQNYSVTLGGTGLKNSRASTVMVPDLHTAGIVFNDISDSTYEINADTALKEVTHSIIQVVSHTAGSATLDTIIDGGVPNGTQITIIGTNDVKTVIIAEKTYSNIVLAGSAPITLGKYDNIVFIKYDNVWVEQSRADN